eukprot:1340194-Lingulodinium_polyedra.AAC.1
MHLLVAVSPAMAASAIEEWRAAAGCLGCRWRNTAALGGAALGEAALGPEPTALGTFPATLALRDGLDGAAEDV